jgi:hypothetical protein
LGLASLNKLENFKFYSKLDLIPTWSSQALKIEIKYGCEGSKLRNNFCYENFSRFEMYFKLKFREASMS